MMTLVKNMMMTLLKFTSMPAIQGEVVVFYLLPFKFMTDVKRSLEKLLGNGGVSGTC